MYFKLALKNVRKSYRDFLIYFLTLAFSVCLFYAFNSFGDGQAILALNESQSMMVLLLNDLLYYLSWFIAVIFGFLILYANQYLIKRRKKEFGLYTLLGLNQGKISKILVYETLIIGLFSLVAGILLGTLLSQALLTITAKLMVVSMNYQFVFSSKALGLTLISFSIIFLIVMIFNSFVLKKYQLIDLLRADRTNQSLKIKNIYVSCVIFIISIICLGYTYYLGVGEGIGYLEDLALIIILGSVGTVLFFLSLAGFLLTFVKSSKHLYYRKLNMFVLRNLNSKINSNFLSMSVVCLMLLVSIGALSTGVGLNTITSNQLEEMTQYDASFATPFQEMNSKEELYQQFNIEPQVNEIYQVPLYLSAYQTRDLFVEDSVSHYYQLYIVSLSTYNQIASYFDVEQQSLQGNDALLVSSANLSMDNLLSKDIKQKDITLHVKEILNEKVNFEVGSSYTDLLVVEDSLLQNVPTLAEYSNTAESMDEIAPQDTPILASRIIWAINFNDNVDSLAFKTSVEKIMNQLNLASTDYIYDKFSVYTKDEVYEKSRGITVIAMYIGVYLGIIFLLTSSVVLSLQQLTDANDNQKRYAVLNKIGVSGKMMKGSIFMQIALYFFLPLMLAIVHSIFGLKAVFNTIAFTSIPSITIPAIGATIIILLIYLLYFIITYMSYKSIIFNKK